MRQTLLFVSAVLIAAQCTPRSTPVVEDKPAYSENFNSEKAMQGFLFTQSEKWLTSEGKEGRCLEFTGISEYTPPHRSPHTIGLIEDLVCGSFILEVDLLQTGKEYGHRDMCIIFGFQDPANFYYAHIATAMDDNAHQIMLVDDAPRRKISTFTTKGVDWGLNTWQRIRIERNADTGMIRVFFNGTLIQEANDKTFGKGYIGFGSFDDSGKIDNVRIWSDDAERIRIRTAEKFEKKS